MSTPTKILSYGVILAFTILTVSLPVLTNANVIEQRSLQREFGDSSPEILSINDKDEFREYDGPVINDYGMQALQTKSDNQFIENALINYFIYKQMMNNKMQARTDSIRAQKKRSYWKQCAFNAVSCFG